MFKHAEGIGGTRSGRSPTGVDITVIAYVFYVTLSLLGLDKWFALAFALSLQCDLRSSEPFWVHFVKVFNMPKTSYEYELHKNDILFRLSLRPKILILF